MTRISKDPDERRLEIINASKRLFNEKGFEKTAVSDIVKSIGVAQGTFYYYFKSKDDVFNAIAESFLNEYLDNFESIADNEKLSALEKAEILLDKGVELIKNNEGVMFYLHTKDNMELHERIEKIAVELLTPLVVKLVRQGVEERVFDIEYPEEAVTFLMMGSHFLGDVNIYQEDRETYLRRLQAVEYVVQKVLSIDDVTMEHINDKFMAKFIKLLT